MRNVIISALIALSLFSMPADQAWAKKKVQAFFFYSNACEECFQIKNELLPIIKEKYKEYVEWEEVDVSRGESSDQNLADFVSRKYAKQERAVVPSILVEDTFLGTPAEIRERLDETLQLIAEKDKRKLKATFFYGSHCKECLKFIDEFLRPIQGKYKDDVEWEMADLNDLDKLRWLILLTKKHTGKDVPVSPSVLLGDSFLQTKETVKEKLEEVLREEMGRGVQEETATDDIAVVDMVDVFNKFSLLAIIGGGLLDGVNPCAFAVIIFFISFLALYGYNKREIIFVGSSYCSAVFITYLLIGLGIFKFLYALWGFYTIIKLFYYLVAGLCFAFAGFALYDYYKFRKTKDAGETILQLPKFLKDRIHKVIGLGLRGKKGTGVIGLVITSFVIGILVSLLEAACTGQVYVPVIAYILKSTHLRLKALTYLILYNLMFIFPLLIIFSLSLLGVTSQAFSSFLKKNLGNIKLFLVVLFLALGALILITT